MEPMFNLKDGEDGEDGDADELDTFVTPNEANAMGVIVVPLSVRALHTVLFGYGRHDLLVLMLFTTGVVLALQTWFVVEDLYGLNCSLNKDCDHSKYERVKSLTKSDAHLYWSWSLLFNSAVIVEAVVNARFGFKFCRDAQLEDLIRWVRRVSDQNHWARALRNLKLVGCIGWSAIFLMGMLRVGQSGNTNMPWSLFLIVVWNDGFGYGIIVYLCALWLWSNWTMHLVGMHVIKQMITQETVLNMEAGSHLEELLNQMKKISRFWAFNHLTRLITTTCIAVAALGRYSIGKGIFFMILGGVLFLLVWITAAAPGILSDVLFRRLLQRTTGIAQCQEAYSADERLKCMLLVQNVQALQVCGGMQFAYIPITFQKSVAIGTFLAYLVTYVVHINHM
jgi:hypothetical protein